MFILKFLFILLLVAFIILLALTIYKKFKNPEQSFLSCIPFIDEFSTKDADSIDITPDTNANTEEKIAENEKQAIETLVAKETPIITEKQNVKSKSVKKSPSTKKTVSKAKKPAKPSTVKKVKSKKGDNIKKINGIGPAFEKKLNSININTFEQIAAWSNSDIERIDEQLELSGRPQREEWVAKATILAAEKNT